MTSEIVVDPVSHISISGVHGGDELNERLENAPNTPAVAQRHGVPVTLGQLLIGVAIGAAAMYLFDPVRGKRRRWLLRDLVTRA